MPGRRALACVGSIHNKETPMNLGLKYCSM
jgi:hypothetical protein